MSSNKKLAEWLRAQAEGFLSEADRLDPEGMKVGHGLAAISQKADEENLIRFADVPLLDWLPKRRGGSRLGLNTLHRWHVDGCRGVKLEAVCVGGVRCTTEAALMRFFERLAGAPPESRPPTEKQHEAAQERARATVEKHIGRREHSRKRK